MPLAVPKLYTYKITRAEVSFISEGVRVAVEFGKSKIYTALVFSIHQNAPKGYDAKEIFQILDKKPIVTSIQLKFWEWIADYYMCTIGEVYRSALPSAFLLESETVINLKKKDFEQDELSDEEFLICEALQHQQSLSIFQVTDILHKKKIFPFINSLLKKEIIEVKEQIYEQYKPKIVKYVRLKEVWNSSKKLPELLEKLSRAKKQRELILQYFQLASKSKKIRAIDLQKKANTSASVVNALVEKQFFEYYYYQVDRVDFSTKNKSLLPLTDHQKNALKSIKKTFETKNITLFKGITSSGKTEIYAHLIQETLSKGKQVLYLLPEIALTTQLIARLQQYFGNYLSVYHSKYSVNERVEVWNNVLSNSEKAQVIIGVRSSLFLPFSNLGLIIVDEEHEPSFKQFNPAPRYHARDAATVLALHYKSKVLLGSATPSVESYSNFKQGKFGFVELNFRYKNILLPEIELVDIKEKYRKKRMKGHFSDRMLTMISETLAEKEQIILFQNRRGYSPLVECEDCGVSPECPNCDVSLTYHNYKKELRCHYCGYKQAMLQNCKACGSYKLNTKGFGTEQIEEELVSLFPNAKIGRMDLDTTRGKYAYQKIIHQFQNQEIDILVGTQMLSKGLDFGNVTLVGIMNADNMLNFPDFRAYERSYQLMVQVSGRAGRMKKRGRVAIQTYNPYHQILQQVSTNSYEQMYNEQMNDRWKFKYPPYYKLIKITLKHKNEAKLDEGANWMSQSLKNQFGDYVLGPSTPSVARIQNNYIRNILIKISLKQSAKNVKDRIHKVKNAFQSIKEFRPIRLIIDVDTFG